MQASIHVHQILNHLKSEPMSEYALTDWVTREWGDEARFHTCSQKDMTFSDVLVFLRRRKKILESAGALVVNEARICNHGE
ncbi:YecH family protein [Enterovibrio sp. ZSDZ35]|uniref:YecH family protein n=1 Tax=Enterovibrio qingdaonensis TaxID=2899818 RepID=A0ABT5QNY2_9GAMM|nr:YecH family metal-binding protein [Enterovibrio sp. ZSDZ35]MDD1781996.1 YecH family protein [Enterovibrio sp. ZSDZ35]